MKFNGFIPLWRTLLDWEWIDDPIILSVWVQCLLRASFRDSYWRGIEIKRGQLFTSSESLAKCCGVSRQQVRRALTKLQNSKNLTIESTSQGMLITVCKYEAYNDLNDQINQPCNQPSTSDQPAINQPSTSDQPHLNNENKNKRETSKQKESLTLPFDETAFVDAWKDWIQHRKEKKKPLTPTSIKLQLQTLEDMGVDRAIAAIKISIEKGWTGIFEANGSPYNSKKPIFDNGQGTTCDVYR
jgi:biotin operon repressor